MEDFLFVIPRVFPRLEHLAVFRWSLSGDFYNLFSVGFVCLQPDLERGARSILLDTDLTRLLDFFSCCWQDSIGQKAVLI